MVDEHPMQPIYLDRQRTARFKQNAIVRFLLDAGPFDMNKLACMTFSAEDREQFAQLIGYSVAGLGKLPYVSEEVVELADRTVARLLRKRKGK